MVGAVGIENNDVKNFKDLRGMRRNIKAEGGINYEKYPGEGTVPPAISTSQVHY